MRPRLIIASALALPVCVHAAPYDAALRGVTDAANTADPPAARRFAVSPDGRAFPWIVGPEGGVVRRIFQPHPWKAAVLPPAFSNDGRPLAVFHTWHAPESDGDHIHPIVHTAAGWRFDREIRETDTQGYRIVSHALKVALQPARKRADIEDLFVVRRVADARRVVYLRLSDDFTVTALTADGRQVPYRQAGGIVAARLPLGPKVRLRMRYAGVVDHPIISAIRPDLAVLTAYYYPTLGRLPATADVEARVPAGWTAITQGELTGKATVGGTAVFRYHNALPVNYFSLCAGPYTETTRALGRVTLHAYLLKAKPGFAESLLDPLATALPYFEKRFGPYPYTRYSIVDAGSILGYAALEGYSMASYGTLTLTPMVVSHELSHTWWGGVVPNTYLRSWWNEAFASFSDDAFSRMRNGVTTPHPTDQPWWPRLHTIASAPLSTARDESSVTAIAYGKGMVVLRLLERRLGADVFDRCLQTFVRDNRSAQDPNWPDFQRAVEKVTGKDWTWFFTQWVGRAGWPALRLADVKAAEVDGRWQVTGRILQDGAPYRLNVLLRVDSSGGNWIVPVENASTPFFLECHSGPSRLALDPDLDIPREMGLDDVAVFSGGKTRLEHSREERLPSPFGGM